MTYVHLDNNYNAHTEPRVSHEAHIKQVAHAALKNIPGGTQLVNDTFKTGVWQKPFKLPGKRHIDQPLHLGFG